MQQNIEKVAEALGDELQNIIFVGASINTLLVDHVSKQEVRETYDIDAMATIRTYTEYYELEQKLVKKGFARSLAKNDPICRWTLDDIIFDLMPAYPIEGLATNKWFKEALPYIMEITLDNGLVIKILNPIFFIASKLEAFGNRGKKDNFDNWDVMHSKDLEDIIVLIDGRKNIDQEILISPDIVKKFIGTKFAQLISDKSTIHFIRNCLSGANLEERIKRILHIMSGSLPK
jgi:hypothetical protein